MKEIIETSILNPHPSRWPTEVMVGEGESSGLKLSTGSLAKLADGAAVAQVKDSRRFVLFSDTSVPGWGNSSHGDSVSGQDYCRTIFSPDDG